MSALSYNSLTELHTDILSQHKHPKSEIGAILLYCQSTCAHADHALITQFCKCLYTTLVKSPI